MNNNFTEAARAEAQVRWPSYPAVGFSGADDRQHAFREGASWARTHLAAQEPTDAEVEALCRAVDEQAGYWLGPITASMVLQETRRAAREARP